MVCLRFFFFFQAEDGIRDLIVTGVQTCALPISIKRLDADLEAHIAAWVDLPVAGRAPDQDRAIGLAEASELLDIKPRTLERPSKWRQLGGYRDIDGHIKFRLLDLRRHVARRSRILG